MWGLALQSSSFGESKQTNVESSPAPEASNIKNAGFINLRFFYDLMAVFSKNIENNVGQLFTLFST